MKEFVFNTRLVMSTHPFHVRVVNERERERQKRQKKTAAIDGRNNTNKSEPSAIHQQGGTSEIV